VFCYLHSQSCIAGCLAAASFLIPIPTPNKSLGDLGGSFVHARM